MTLLGIVNEMEAEAVRLHALAHEIGEWPGEMHVMLHIAAQEKFTWAEAIRVTIGASKG